MSKIPPRYAKIIAFIIPFAILVYSQYRLRYFTWDDSYITYRHALNMVRGFGPVYNPGELADGITNYLFACIIALGFHLKLEPVAFSKWLGILSSWAIMFGVWGFIVRRLKLSYISAGIALLLLTTNGMFAVESVGGLETLLFTLLIFWILWEITAFQSERKSNIHLGIAGVASGVAMLMRPDAILFIIAVLILLISLKDVKGSLSRILFYILPIIVIFLPYFIRHWMIFGYPFPNSYYAKKVATSNLFARGFMRLKDNLADIGTPIFAIFIPIASYKIIPQISGKEYSKTEIYKTLVLFIAARLIFIVISGGSWMGWGRFLLPVLPMIYILIALHFEELWKSFEKNVPAKVMTTIILIFLISINLKSSGDNLFRETTPSLHLDRIHIPLGLALRDILEPGESISFGDAGALPYYADVVNIDPAGLCDRHIAHLKGEFDIKTNPDYILDRKPAIIILNSINPYPEFNPQSPIDKKIVSNPRLTNEYEFILAFEAWSEYNLWLFARKDRATQLKDLILSHPQISESVPH